MTLRADLTRAFVSVGTADPLPDDINPERSLVLVPSPVELRRVIAIYGSPMTDDLAAGSVPPVSARAREDAAHRAQHPPDWLLASETSR